MPRTVVTMTIAAEFDLAGVLPPIIYGVAYTQTLHQIGGIGIASWNTDSTLPAGITAVDNGDGTITIAGTTTDIGSGTWPVTIDGLDADRTPCTRTYSLQVQVLPIIITGDAGDMRLGDADTYPYAATGGSGTITDYSVGSGALPPGWTINHSTGLLTRAPITVGSYAWTIVATDSLGNVSAPYADSAAIRYPVITLTGSFASLGIIGVPYSSDITITGGDGTYSNQRFTLGAVSGMALSIVTVSGVKKLRLSGTPTTHETDSITVAVDAHEFDGSTVTATHSQSITEDPALTLTGSFTSPTTLGASYQSDLLLGGGDGTYTLHGGTGLSTGSLPAGLALSIVTVSGSKYLRLSGTSTTSATSAFTVSIDSGDGQNVTSPQSVVVVSPIVLTGTFATPLYDGVPYSQTIAITGGSGTYITPAVASGSLPTGLSLSVSGSNLVLSGTCSSGVTFTFTCTVHDSLGGVSSASSSQSLTRQDQYFSSVLGLYHCDGTNGATVCTDSSSHGFTGNLIDSGTLVTATKKFGSAGAALGRMYSPTSTAYQLGTGDFCIEMWINPNTGGGGAAYGRIIQFSSNAQDGGLWWARLNNPNPLQTLVQVNSGGGYVTIHAPADTIPNGAWTHIALTRASGVWRLFYGGVKVSEVTYTGGGNNIHLNGFNYYNVGRNQSSGENFNGYFDDLRITKGAARYTAAFTPPIDAFPDS